MLKGVINPSCIYGFTEHVQEEGIYGSDEFRMYVYKIKRCTRARSHDWTQCPYAHRGEKARRRDPRKVAYTAIACPAFRRGRCGKGDACEFAHGVFEFWLHPDKYRTRACTAGRFCRRKVCFFAHTPSQLRPLLTTPESKYKFHFPLYKERIINGGDHQLMMMMMGTTGQRAAESCSCGEGVSNLLKSLRERKFRSTGFEVSVSVSVPDSDSDSDSPHLDWITELVK